MKILKIIKLIIYFINHSINESTERNDYYNFLYTEFNDNDLNDIYYTYNIKELEANKYYENVKNKLNDDFNIVVNIIIRESDAKNLTYLEYNRLKTKLAFFKHMELLTKIDYINNEYIDDAFETVNEIKNYLCKNEINIIEEIVDDSIIIDNSKLSNITYINNKYINNYNYVYDCDDININYELSNKFIFYKNSDGYNLYNFGNYKFIDKNKTDKFAIIYCLTNIDNISNTYFDNNISSLVMEYLYNTKISLSYNLFNTQNFTKHILPSTYYVYKILYYNINVNDSDISAITNEFYKLDILNDRDIQEDKFNELRNKLKIKNTELKGGFNLNKFLYILLIILIIVIIIIIIVIIIKHKNKYRFR